MPYIITEADLIRLIATWLFVGLVPFAVMMFLLKLSPGGDFLISWLSKSPLILLKRQDGSFKIVRAKYNHGFYIARGMIFQPTTDGTDIGHLKGIRLGVTSESFGATISPDKIASVELWKNAGLAGFFEAELFNYYVKNNKHLEHDREVAEGVMATDLYDLMKKHYGLDTLQDVQKHVEQLKTKIPNDNKAPVFWEEGKGLFANVGKLVDYNAIRTWQLQYLRPDLVDAQIKAHVEARAAEIGSGAQIIKFVGIGLMVMLSLVGLMILLNSPYFRALLGMGG